jgi:hypothetical protein
VSVRALLVAGIVATSAAACGGDDHDGIGEGACVVPAGDAAAVPDFLAQVVCEADFLALASEPLDVTLPGARSGKVVVDQADADTLYFQNSTRFEIHYDFVSTHLSGGDLPVVGSLANFNAEMYFTPDRRFLLGAVTYYEQPQRWTLELAPYDTASVDMIVKLFDAVRTSGYFGRQLAFHPTSEQLAAVAEELPERIPVVTTDELYEGIDYQPLSLGTAVGRLHFTTAAAIATEYLSYQDLVVLDEAPNDISVVQGIITQEFQTPLSHINVLSRNRHTPNMGLRGALASDELTALDGKLVKLEVGPSTWTIAEVSEAEAMAWWEAHAPTPIVLPPVDTSITAIIDLDDVTPEPTTGETLRGNIREAVAAYGGKSAQYSILRRTPDVPIKRAFGIPLHWYVKFMTDNGFFARIAAFENDPQFVTTPSVRDAALAQLRADIMAAPLDAGFLAALAVKEAEWQAMGVTKLRFRSSSNSEDLDGFPCAGCYNSYSGVITDRPDVEAAIKNVYADVWTFRGYEEREYYGVAHATVAMALLVHENFEDEEANGVAVTANPFDPTGNDPAQYINVQLGGGAEVVSPPPGVYSDQILYYFGLPNQPVAYLSHSNLTAPGQNVLTTTQLHELGVALDAIHTRFSRAYGPASGNNGWYAMDVEFKFDDQATPGQAPTLYVKQARPYPDPWAGTR